MYLSFSKLHCLRPNKAPLTPHKDRVTNSLVTFSGTQHNPWRLSLEELDVIERYVLTNESNQSIADFLVKSKRAVEGNFRKIFKKMNVDNRLKAYLAYMKENPEGPSDKFENLPELTSNEENVLKAFALDSQASTPKLAEQAGVQDSTWNIYFKRIMKKAGVDTHEAACKKYGLPVLTKTETVVLKAFALNPEAKLVDLATKEGFSGPNYRRHLSRIRNKALVDTNIDACLKYGLLECPPTSRADGLPNLKPVEQEVLKTISLNPKWTQPQVADYLGLDYLKVKNLIANINNRIKVGSVIDACLKYGFLETDPLSQTVDELPELSPYERSVLETKALNLDWTYEQIAHSLDIRHQDVRLTLQKIRKQAQVRKTVDACIKYGFLEEDPKLSKVNGLSKLNPNEEKVLKMKGLHPDWGYQELSDTLGISLSNVKYFLATAREKIGVHRSNDAARSYKFLKDES